jgi:hypothetical protein
MQKIILIYVIVLEVVMVGVVWQLDLNEFQVLLKVALKRQNKIKSIYTSSKSDV